MIVHTAYCLLIIAVIGQGTSVSAHTEEWRTSKQRQLETVHLSIVPTYAHAHLVGIIISVTGKLGNRKPGQTCHK